MSAQRSKSRPAERRFIRHPTRMPIRFDLHGDVTRRDDHLRNISEGGVCFATTVALDPGQLLHLYIPLLGQQFEVEACVAWCRAVVGGHEVGVRFLSPQDLFCVRMVEQLCYIEDYRAEVAREEGRQLSSEEAAQEWIDRFSEQFPGLH